MFYKLQKYTILKTSSYMKAIKQNTEISLSPQQGWLFFSVLFLLIFLWACIQVLHEI